MNTNPEPISPLTLDEATLGDYVGVVFDATTAVAKKITNPMKRITPADGKLLQSDGNGQAQETEITSLDITGREITTAGANYANYFKAIEVYLPSAFNSFNIRGMISVRIGGTVTPRNFDFYLAGEQSSVTFRTIALKVLAPYSIPSGIKLRAICNTTDKKIYLYIGGKTSSGSSITMYINYVQKNSSNITVTYSNEDVGATPPTGNGTTLEPSATYWEASETENSKVLYYTKELTGTTGGSMGSITNLAHGIDATKIISVFAQVIYSGTSDAILPGYSSGAGSEYSVLISPTNIGITLHPTNSGSILIKVIKVTVTYKD